MPYQPATNVDELVKQSKAMLSQSEAEGSKPFAGSTYESEYKAGKTFTPAILSSLGAKSALNSIQGTINQGEQAKMKMDEAKKNAPEPVPPDMYEGETEAEKIKRLSEEAFKNSQGEYDNLAISYHGEHQAELQGLKTQWEQLRKQQEEINQWNEAISTQAQQRSGEARYTPVHSADVIAQKKTQGLEKLQELDLKYQSAVASAKAAFSQKESELAYKKAQEAQKYYQDTLTEIRAQEKEARDIAKENAEALAKEKQNIEEGKNKILLLAAEAGSSPDIIQAIGNSKDLTEAVIAAGGSLKQSKNLPTSVQEYLFNNEQRVANGLPAQTYDQWLTVDANRKAKIAAAQTAGSLTSAQASMVNSASSSFEGSPIVKQFIEIQDKYMNMQANVGQGDGATDIAYIYDLMKALDPTSVVRTEEYDTGAARSGNIFSGKLAELNGLIDPEGGFVSEAAKQNIINLIDRRYQTKKAQYENLRNEKVRVLEAKGVQDAGNFLTEYDFNNENNDTRKSIINEADAEERIVEFVSQSDENAEMFDAIQQIAPDASAMEIAKQLGIL